MSTDDYLRRRAKILKSQGIDPNTEFEDLPEELKEAVRQKNKEY